ncbi:MAG: hypothetical protein R6U44_02810 [Archaeoglobaceae archaeon]
MKRVIVITVLVVLFFPLTFFVESHIPRSLLIIIERLAPTLFIALIEEFLGRLVPLLLLYYVYKETTNLTAINTGIAAGVTFGIIELFTKSMFYGNFHITTIIPILPIHVVNGLLQSYIINFSFKKRSYELIPAIYIITAAWHFLYNYLTMVQF